jgi:hypothetical protein
MLELQDQNKLQLRLDQQVMRKRQTMLVMLTMHMKPLHSDLHTMLMLLDQPVSHKKLYRSGWHTTLL